MSATAARSSVAFATVVLALAAGCSHAPSPSNAGAAYRGKLTDDVLVEASSTVLVTTKDVVVAMDCASLMRAQAGEDGATVIDRAVAAGTALRLPPNVTLYTLPWGPNNPRSAPLVVTDDRAAGRLCTPDGYAVVKS